MIIQVIEKEILNKFQQQFPKLKDTIEYSINSVQRVEREFTGVGAFVLFYYENREVFGDKALKGKRYNSIIIKSKEFEHNCPVDIVFREDGLIDYLELSMGMKELKYPKEYEICYYEPNVIIDSNGYKNKAIK